MKIFSVSFFMMFFVLCSMAAEIDRSLVPAFSNDRLGYIDKDSRQFVIPPVYTDGNFFVDGVAIVTLHPSANGMALIDRENNIILHGYSSIRPAYVEGRLHPDYFDQSKEIYSKVFIVEEKGKHGVFHTDKGWLLNPEKVVSFHFISSDSFYYDGNLVLDGEKVSIPPNFKAIRIEYGFIWIEERNSVNNSKMGILRTDGSVLIPPNYNEIEMTASGYWLGSKFKLTRLRALSDNKDYVTTDLLSPARKILKTFKSRYIPDVEGDIYTYTSKGKDYSYDAVTAKAVTQNPTQEVTEINEISKEYRIVKTGNLYGLADINGNILREPEFLNSFYFNHLGHARAYNGKNGVIDKRGRDVIPFIYDAIFAPPSPTATPVYLVVKEGLWGLLDIGGEAVLPTEYGYIGAVANHPDWYTIENKDRTKTGLFNLANGLLITPAYDGIRPSGNIIVAYSMGKANTSEQYTLISMDGHKLENYNHVEQSVSLPRAYIVKKGSKYGLADEFGILTVPCLYERIFEADPIYYRAVDRNGTILYIDRDGTEYRPVED